MFLCLYGRCSSFCANRMYHTCTNTYNFLSMESDCICQFIYFFSKICYTVNINKFRNTFKVTTHYYSVCRYDILYNQFFISRSLNCSVFHYYSQHSDDHPGSYILAHLHEHILGIYSQKQNYQSMRSMHFLIFLQIF